jgi:hypothetical protein
VYIQLRGWYSKDDVVVEWKKLEGQLALHAHCYVSGPNLLLDLAAEFRYHIFSKEMPLVSVLLCNSLCTSELFGQIFGLLHTLVFSTISKVCSSQVLEAVLDGDAALFTKHPELKDSLVWVYFHSRLPKYNRLECWGPLKDAAQVKSKLATHGLQEQFYINDQLILPSFCLKTRNALTSMTFYEQQSPQVAPKILKTHLI